MATPNMIWIPIVVDYERDEVTAGQSGATPIRDGLTYTGDVDVTTMASITIEIRRGGC